MDVLASDLLIEVFKYLRNDSSVIAYVNIQPIGVRPAVAAAKGYIVTKS